MTASIFLAKFKTLLLKCRQTLLKAKTEGETAVQTVELDQSRIGRTHRYGAFFYMPINKTQVKEKFADINILLL